MKSVPGISSEGVYGLLYQHFILTRFSPLFGEFLLIHNPVQNNWLGCPRNSAMSDLLCDYISRLAYAMTRVGFLSVEAAALTIRFNFLLQKQEEGFGIQSIYIEANR